MLDRKILTEYVHLEKDRWCRIELQEQSMHIFEEKINEFGVWSATSREIHILRKYIDEFVNELRKLTGLKYYPMTVKVRVYNIPLSKTVGTVKTLCKNWGCATLFHRYQKKDILISPERHTSDLWDYLDTVRTSKVPKNCAGISIPDEKVEAFVRCIEKLMDDKKEVVKCCFSF